MSGGGCNPTNPPPPPSRRIRSSFPNVRGLIRRGFWGCSIVLLQWFLRKSIGKLFRPPHETQKPKLPTGSMSRIQPERERQMILYIYIYLCYIHTHIHVHMHICTHTQNPYRQTDRQTDRQKDRETERERERDRQIAP